MSRAKKILNNLVEAKHPGLMIDNVNRVLRFWYYPKGLDQGGTTYMIGTVARYGSVRSLLYDKRGCAKYGLKLTKDSLPAPDLTMGNIQKASGEKLVRSYFPFLPSDTTIHIDDGRGTKLDLTKTGAQIRKEDTSEAAGAAFYSIKELQRLISQVKAGVKKKEKGATIGDAGINVGPNGTSVHVKFTTKDGFSDVSNMAL